MLIHALHSVQESSDLTGQKNWCSGYKPLLKTSQHYEKKLSVSTRKKGFAYKGDSSLEFFFIK